MSTEARGIKSDPHTTSTHAFANTVLGGLVVVVFVAWHLAVATTIDTVGLGDVGATLDALAGLEPVAGLPGSPETSAVAPLLAFSGYLLLLLFVILGGAWAFIELRGRTRSGRGQSSRETRGMATERQVVAAVGEDKVRASAEQTRPGMSPTIRKHAGLAELGLKLGNEQASGKEVWLTLEDHLTVIAAAGGGKTSAVMVPAALTAPGALIVTSNEVSILDLIATARAKRGRVWVFDPLGRTSWPEPMVWNPVQDCEEGETALARGIAFAAGLKADGGSSTNAGFFQRNATIALSRMLHAAALGGHDMSEVLRWATNLDTDGKIAASLIRHSTDERAEKSWAAMLDAVSSGADETVASSRQTLQQVVEPLTLRKVTRWVTPAPGVPEFDARAFATSTDTLVLISDDSSSTNVGPLCTMLLQEVMDSVKAVVPFLEHGRLDPPMRLVGDEFANIAPVEKAPELSTEVRKLGMQLVLAFQSEQQLRSRWGDRGQTLLEMSTELVLAGVKSTASLKRYSDLAGKVEVEEHTTSYSDGDVRGGSTSTREREVMRADQVRTLADGTGLLVWRNAAPMVVQMTPWFREPYAEDLARDAKTVAARRAAHAAATRPVRANHPNHTASDPANHSAEKAPS